MSYGFNSDKSKFPLGLASDLPDPTKPPMQIIGELQNQIIDSASIENGATASKAYASGNYVCFQGALCKASKAISQGDTLSIGTSANDNLTLTDAAAEFVRLNSDLSPIGTISVNTGSFVGNSSSTYKRVAELTSLPAGTYIFSGYCDLSTNSNAQLTLQLRSGGTMLKTVRGSGINGGGLTLSYPITILSNADINIALYDDIANITARGELRAVRIK